MDSISIDKAKIKFDEDQVAAAAAKVKRDEEKTARVKLRAEARELEMKDKLQQLPVRAA